MKIAAVGSARHFLPLRIVERVGIALAESLEAVLKIVVALRDGHRFLLPFLELCVVAVADALQARLQIVNAGGFGDDFLFRVGEMRGVALADTAQAVLQVAVVSGGGDDAPLVRGQLRVIAIGETVEAILEIAVLGNDREVLALRGGKSLAIASVESIHAVLKILIRARRGLRARPQRHQNDKSRERQNGRDGTNRLHIHLQRLRETLPEDQPTPQAVVLIYKDYISFHDMLGRGAKRAHAVSCVARDRLAVRFGMMPRGEAGLIFAGIGKSIGVVDDSLFSAVILIVMVTTLLTPVALRWTVQPMPNVI